MRNSDKGAINNTQMFITNMLRSMEIQVAKVISHVVRCSRVRILDAIRLVVGGVVVG